MKKVLATLLLACSLPAFAQTSIGTNVPDSSAALDVSSTSKGMLIPRMTAEQRIAIAKPAEGLMVYQNDEVAGLYIYAGGVWNPIATFTTNTATGQQTLSGNTTGTGNVALGSNALKTNTTGTNNTAIGYGADVSAANLTNATAIGYNAKVGGSNSLVLGAIGTKVGIGTATPQYNLDVAGTARFGNTVNIPAPVTNPYYYFYKLTVNSSGLLSSTILPEQLALRYLICVDGYYPQWDNVNAASVFPIVGQIILTAVSTPSSNFLECNGQLLKITSFSALYTLIGTTYGGDGITTFALPDLSNKIPIGVDRKVLMTSQGLVTD